MTSSLPPGAAGHPLAPWNQEDGPCDVCGQSTDDCVCPECPACGAYGDPSCYERHGLVRSFGQVALRAAYETELNEEAEREEALYRQELALAERERVERWFDEPL